MDPEPDLRPVLVFDLGGETFGVRLDMVKEIYRASYLQPVPLAPPAIRGLADVRGRMVTAADLSELLAGRRLRPETRGDLMILAEPQDHFALWLPSEIDLCSLDLGALRPRPGNEGEAELFDGFVTSDGAMVNVLSTEKVFLHCEQEVFTTYRGTSG